MTTNFSLTELQNVLNTLGLTGDASFQEIVEDVKKIDIFGLWKTDFEDEKDKVIFLQKLIISKLQDPS